MDRTRHTPTEAMLREELAQADRALSRIAPMIAHMLESPGRALLNDAIVARLRGMLDHLALQLLIAADPGSRRERPVQTAIDQLADRLSRDSGILSHLYALAMEGHLADQLEQQAALDPVLSPLLQELIASDDPAMSARAMDALAAQSRFVQSQRRLQLPLRELPADLFSDAIEILRHRFGQPEREPVATDDTYAALHATYEENRTRLVLFEQLAAMMGAGSIAMLELAHAGLALFATGLTVTTQQPRDLIILACHERQAARLALSLRAAGQGRDAIKRQFALLGAGDWNSGRIGEIDPAAALTLLDPQPLLDPERDRPTDSTAQVRRRG